MNSAVFLQQLQGFAHIEQIGRGWVGSIPTLPELRFGILDKPFLGCFETEVHATTMSYKLWYGESHGWYRALIWLIMQRKLERGSEIDIFEGLGQ
jgi:hypothetical protein